MNRLHSHNECEEFSTCDQHKTGPQPGQHYYLPYPEKVARVCVVELGTGGRNLKRVPRNPVVVSEDGGEHVVSANNLYSDELAAAIRSAEIAREIEEES